MAYIVELRDVGNEKLREMLENSREELFNLRFQQASARLDDPSRLRTVRREIAQLETVLHMRSLAVEQAATMPEVALLLEDKQWHGEARFSYEDSAWQVEIFDEEDTEISSVLVDLNRKR